MQLNAICDHIVPRTETDRQTDRQTDTETDRERERERERDGERFDLISLLRG